MIIGFGVKDIAKCCSGLWQFLTARVNGRTAVALERERNRATTDAIKALPSGAELLETEQNGRLRMIRMPYPQPPIPPLHRRPKTWSQGELTE